jgi:hypothetical protein
MLFISQSLDFSHSRILKWTRAVTHCSMLVSPKLIIVSEMFEATALVRLSFCR